MPPPLSMPYLTSGIMPGSTLCSSPPGTLSDLKKHRSLNRTTSNPHQHNNNGSLEVYPCSTSSSSTSSSSSSGDRDRDVVVATSIHDPTFHNAYTSPPFIPSYEYCNWNYSQSEFDSASFAYSGGSALICNNNIKPQQQAFCKDDFSNYDYLYDDAGGFINMHSINTNKMNNKMYINNLTGVSNELPCKKAPSSYGAPPSPTMSLSRYVGEPTEIRDYDDDGRKKCCVIV
jgi:hypothetical protein